jgi:excisionase family DNA binding protein
MTEYLENEMKNYPMFLKTSEVAKIVGVGRSTIWREIKSGNLAAVKVRGKLLVLRADLINYLSERRNIDGKRNAETVQTGKVAGMDGAP